MSTSRTTLDLWRMDDHGDGISTTVQHMFALCEVLHVSGARGFIPAELGFRAGPLLDRDQVADAWPDAEYLSRMDAYFAACEDGETPGPLALSPEEARRTLRLLDRYRGIWLRYHPLEGDE